MRSMRGTVGRLARLLAAAALCLCLPPAGAAPAAAPTQYKREAGPYRVEAVLFDWRDAKRNREVPVKVYFPAAGRGPFPVIVLSHGAGGSREGYEYLGRHWASHGYVSIHPQHLGSDEQIWRGRADPLAGMKKAIADPRNAFERPRDVSFVLDKAEELNRTDPRFRGRLDLDRVGVAGHSFGAWTALAVAGQTFVLPGGREVSFTDKRVKAVVAMSAPVPRRAARSRAFGSIHIPCLHMTGTLDETVLSDVKPAERRVPFDNINGADQYLVTFIGGDHMVFSGRGRLPGGAKDELFQDLIRQGTTAFWDAYLRGDERARSWLAEGGYAAALGRDASFEKKLR